MDWSTLKGRTCLFIIKNPKHVSGERVLTLFVQGVDGDFINGIDLHGKTVLLNTQQILRLEVENGGAASD